MNETNKGVQYDVFISYSHYDKEWVRNWLLIRLESAGLCVCIDHRDFIPGLPSLINIENSIVYSKKMLIILTPNWIKSKWTNFESLLIQTNYPIGMETGLIPLLLESCDLPKRIAMLTYLDFTQQDKRELELQRLIAVIGAKSANTLTRDISNKNMVNKSKNEQRLKDKDGIQSIYSDQRIGTVEVGAKNVGIEVDGVNNGRIEAKQKIEVLKGKSTGVKIHRFKRNNESCQSNE